MQPRMPIRMTPVGRGLPTLGAGQILSASKADLLGKLDVAPERPHPPDPLAWATHRELLSVADARTGLYVPRGRAFVAPSAKRAMASLS